MGRRVLYSSVLILKLKTMELSKFNICTKLESGNYAVFNSLSTSVVELTEDLYNQIFINKNYSDEELSSTLLELGILTADNEQDLAEIEQVRKKEIEKREQIVTIFSTNRCNARCYYCFEKGINSNHMSESTADDVVKFLMNFYPEKKLSIKWFGGEPLLNMPAIERITHYLVKNGYILSTHVTTNGSLISKDILNFFKRYYETTTFQITIDDIGDRYNLIKRYTNTSFEDPFQHIVENCKMTMNFGFHVSIRINHLFHELDKGIKIHKQLQEIFGDCDPEKYIIYLAIITLPNKAFNISKEERLQIMMKAREFNKRNKNLDKTDPKYQLYSYDLLPKLSPCSASNRYNLTITADGDIFKCHRLVQYPQYRIGTVTTGIDVEHECFKFFCNWKVTDIQCRNCKMLPLCQGSCLAIKVLENSKIDCEMKDYIPLFLKEYMEDNTQYG